MDHLSEAIEREVRGAYLAWTEVNEPSPAPAWLPVPPETPRLEKEPPDVPQPVPLHPRRVIRWEEIEACMDAAADISEQVRHEVAAAEAVDQAVPQQVWGNALRPSVA